MWLRITADEAAALARVCASWTAPVSDSDRVALCAIYQRWEEARTQSRDLANYRGAARTLYCVGSDDNIEIDLDAAFSVHDAGVWVMGWLHVRSEDVKDLTSEEALDIEGDIPE